MWGGSLHKDWCYVTRDDMIIPASGHRGVIRAVSMLRSLSHVLPLWQESELAGDIVRSLNEESLGDLPRLTEDDLIVNVWS